jgi:hypothetical protein
MKQNVTGVRAANSPKSTRQSPGTGIVVPKEPFLRFKDSWSLRLHTENETAMRLDAAVRGFLGACKLSQVKSFHHCWHYEQIR